MQKIYYRTELYIHRFRITLDQDSPLARSIDRNDSWVRIAAYARDEGHLDFALALEAANNAFAMQKERSDRPRWQYL